MLNLLRMYLEAYLTSINMGAPRGSKLECIPCREWDGQNDVDEHIKDILSGTDLQITDHRSQGLQGLQGMHVKPWDPVFVHILGIKVTPRYIASDMLIPPLRKYFPEHLRLSLVEQVWMISETESFLSFLSFVSLFVLLIDWRSQIWPREQMALPIFVNHKVQTVPWRLGTIRYRYCIVTSCIGVSWHLRISHADVLKLVEPLDPLDPLCVFGAPVVKDDKAPQVGNTGATGWSVGTSTVEWQWQW